MGCGGYADVVRITSFLLPFLAVCILSVALLAGLAEAADYVACRAESISVDGVLDEPDWGRASWSPRFSDLVTGAPGWFDTRAAILWDLENLYVAFRVEEHDVRAFLTVRDSPIYRDNDVELFIDGGDAYYELEINPFGTIYEVFWIWDDARDTPLFVRPEFALDGQRILKLDGIGAHKHPRGMRTGYLDWDMPGLRWGVQVDGSVNDPASPDRGWTIEIAIPWRSLILLADGRALPPVDGDVWRIDCSRFQQYDRKGRKLGLPAGWAWKPHGAFDSHMPEKFPRIRFSTGSNKGGTQCGG